MMQISQKAKARFERKFAETESGCWQWTACRNKYGYGQVGYQYSTHTAHRFSWQIYRGEITDGKHVLHRCDNPACVNPAHLYLGSHQDNMLDRDARGRRRAPSGERNGNSKLREDQVRRIREDDRPTSEIAEEYGIVQGVVRAIKTKRAWAHL
jgi:hypothetical protein